MRKVIIITAINSNVNHVILTVPHAIQEVKLVVLVAIHITPQYILIVLNKNDLLAVLMDSIKIVQIIYVSLVIRNASPAMEEQVQIV